MESEAPTPKLDHDFRLDYDNILKSKELVSNTLSLHYNMHLVTMPEQWQMFQCNNNPRRLDIDEFIARYLYANRVKVSGLLPYHPNPCTATSDHTGECRIHMPAIEAFDTSAAYYRTIFHEVIHSTGCRYALYRAPWIDDLVTKEIYSYEELIAEQGAAILSLMFGVHDQITEYSINYVWSWASHLPYNQKAVNDASHEAVQAINYIIDKARS